MLQIKITHVNEIRVFRYVNNCIYDALFTEEIDWKRACYKAEFICDPIRTKIKFMHQCLCPSVLLKCPQ
jgi:hypothetical protein